MIRHTKIEPTKQAITGNKLMLPNWRKSNLLFRIQLKIEPVESAKYCATIDIIQPIKIAFKTRTKLIFIILNSALNNL